MPDTTNITPASSKDSVVIKGWAIPPINLNDPVDWATALLQENNTALSSVLTGWVSRKLMIIVGAVIGTQIVGMQNSIEQIVGIIVSGVLLVVPIVISAIQRHHKIKIQNASVAVVTAIELAKQANNGVVDFNDPHIKEMLSTIMQDDGKCLVDAIQMYTSYIQTHSKVKPIAPFTSTNSN